MMNNADNQEGGGLCEEDKQVLRENVAAQMEEIEVVAGKLQEYIGEEIPKVKLYEMAINLQHCLLMTDLLNEME